MQVQIHNSWKNLLKEEFKQPYFAKIKEQLLTDFQVGETIYPRGKEIFTAFNLTPVEEVKVVILGQDPYHGPNQAHGLSFSVQKGVKIPPSLQNIYKELQQDIGFKIPSHGNLSSWASQGVLLLNAILTVKKGQPASHRKIGWEQFTNAVIEKLSNQQKQLVFLLWGNFAKSKLPLINSNNGHLILTAAHPSPFSAHNGFFGTKHFSKTNDFLKKHNKTIINWENVD